MKIQNIRLGHATNSSSSHSIVLVSNIQLHEQLLNAEPFNYGWDQFVLVEEKAKMTYVACQFMQALANNNIDLEVAADLIKIWTGIDLKVETDSNTASEIMEKISIDHQSVWMIGQIDLNKKADLAYFQEAAKFFRADNVVICGGNDNTDDNIRPQQIVNVEDPMIELIQYKSTNRVRYDKNNWIMYNNNTGNKIRWTFDDSSLDYNKSTWPELVDIKITDYCPYGCKFCYQSSTNQGIHGDLNHIENLLVAFKEMDVFEIAMGGGEPTMHPHFVDIVNISRSLGIGTNLTTFGTDWIHDEKKLKAVAGSVNSLGISVHSLKHLDKIDKIRQALLSIRAYYPSGKLVAQHVVGTLPPTETVELISQACDRNINILLLGYKPTGFGHSFKPHDMHGFDVMLKLMFDRKKQSHSTISMCGVDTAFVNSSRRVLDTLGVPNVLVTNQEGAFSMYVDAVKLTQGPSSYCDQSQMEPIDLTNIKQSITTAYSKW